jgi:hypothetical protein
VDYIIIIYSASLNNNVLHDDDEMNSHTQIDSVCVYYNNDVVLWHASGTSEEARISQRDQQTDLSFLLDPQLSTTARFPKKEAESSFKLVPSLRMK